MSTELSRRIQSSVHPLGSMLQNHPACQYAVPVYQRDYSWTDDEVQIFLEDLDHALTENLDYYYLGSMVLVSQEGDEDRFRLIDGHQMLGKLLNRFSGTSMTKVVLPHGYVRTAKLPTDSVDLKSIIDVV